MRLKDFFFPILLSILTACSGEAEKANSQKLPNIVYILADDMGYGDVSVLNDSAAFRTPYLDRLAAEGMIFTDAHSNSAVCTPTRYGVLTGRYAWRSRLKEGVLWSYDEHLIDPQRMTVASLLRQNGYHSACIGKWHLGMDWVKDSAGVVDLTKPIGNGPNVYGFDYFFGITASLDIPPYLYIENERVTATVIDTIGAREGKEFWRRGPVGDDFKHVEALPKLTERAVAYIRERAGQDQPFFLYFPLPAPHTPILPTPSFLGASGTNAYGDFVLMVDDVVGQVMQALEENGETNRTLFIFTSDNGCSPMADFGELAGFGHDPSYIFRGHKADIYEGGHRVPFIVRWPGMVQAGAVSGQTVSLTDLLRTCAAVVGDTLPDNAGEDSYDLLPHLLGEAADQPLREATVHHSINGSFAIRQGDWKLIFCPGSGGWSDPTPKRAAAEGLPALQLYNLQEDPGETRNLAEHAPDVADRLTRLMQRYIDQGRSTPGAPQSNDGTEVVLPPSI